MTEKFIARPTDNQRSSRLKLCRAAADFQHAILDIETTCEMKGELVNMVRLLLRMALRINDGEISPIEPIRTW